MEQVGRGDLAILDWDNAVYAASALTDDHISVNLLDDSNLHDHLRKCLYVPGVSTLPGDAG